MKMSELFSVFSDPDIFDYEIGIDGKHAITKFTLRELLYFVREYDFEIVKLDISPDVYYSEYRGTTMTITLKDDSVLADLLELQQRRNDTIAKIKTEIAERNKYLETI